jgi:UDP-glucuronate 4-epimerase
MILNETILITGAAGFIGYHTIRSIATLGYNVIGIDNINDYYDTSLKINRLKELGFLINDSIESDKIISSTIFKNLKFIKSDIKNKNSIDTIFSKFNIKIVCHLAAQAGVRFSIENPYAYLDSNIIGFQNILENCRNYKIKHLVYASSSSVYGNNVKVPFQESDSVDEPISVYAATKKSNELMAYTYSHLFSIKTTGLRFFTVYGPWGRPDMAMYLFTNSILNNNPIKLFGKGKLFRDFTYIDDIVQGILQVLFEEPINKSNYKIYNLGFGKPVQILDFIKILEKKTGLNSKKVFLDKQPGDVNKTWCDMSSFKNDYEYSPKVNLELGLENYLNWFKNYYKK